MVLCISRRILAGALLLGSPLVGCVALDGTLSRSELARVDRVFKPGRGQAREAPGDRGNQYAGRADAVELGRYLFFFEGFTAVGQATSCASCHDPDKNFSDDARRGRGASGEPLARRSPSLYQAVHRHFLFWDGRTDSLWSQALAPIEDHNEMGGNRLRALHVIAEHPQLGEMYARVFGAMPALPAETDAYPCEDAAETAVRRVPTQREQKAQLGQSAAQNDAEPLPEAADVITGGKNRRWCANWEELSTPEKELIDGEFANIGKAIAAYEARIVAEDAPFDAVLARARRGEAVVPDASFDADAVRGLELFVSRKANCAACHSGPDLTDDRFHFLGITDFTAKTGELVAPALWVEGAFQVYGNEFSCREAARFGASCSPRAISRLEGAPSVKTILKLPVAQRRTAAQVRTPSLRNVAGNRFFMHDGSRGSADGDALKDAVGFYATLREDQKIGVGVVKSSLKAKVGRKVRRLSLRTDFKKRVDRRARHIDLNEDDIRHLTAFLRTLTGRPIDAKLRTDPWAVSPAAPTTAPAP